MRMDNRHAASMRRPGDSGAAVLRLAAAQLVAEDDRLGDLLLGLAPLPALALDGQVGLFFSDAQIALQDALGAIDDFSRLEPLGQLGVLDLEARHLDLGADEEPDGGDELN